MLRKIYRFYYGETVSSVGRAHHISVEDWLSLFLSELKGEKDMKNKDEIMSYLKRGSPIILTCMGAAGVVMTSVMAVRATPKALKLIYKDSRINHDGDPYAYTNVEAVRSAWKCYIPSVLIGTSTIVCIFGANVLSRHQKAALTSAYALVNNAYQEYRSKVKELYGEEIHQTIVDSIAKDACKDVYISTPGICDCSSLDFDEHDPEDNRLFYDVFSNRYFENSAIRVIEAEYHLNRNWWLGAGICLNDFYNLLGLDAIDEGDELSWFPEDGIGWIDFNHHKVVLDDGLEVYVIEFVFTPRLATEYD